VVTFAKKCQIAGYFSAPKMRPKEGYRVFNTWLGDPAKLLMLETILEQYEEHDLVNSCQVVGEQLIRGLRDIQKNHQGKIGRIRGRGTFSAFTCYNTTMRDALVANLRQAGVQCGGCGAFSIRLRPAMVFQGRHAEEFLDTFDTVLGETDITGECQSWDGDWNTSDPRNTINVMTGTQGAFHALSDE